MARRFVTSVVVAWAAAVVSASAAPVPPDAALGADGPAGFHDCEPPYVYEGDATIAELGIDLPEMGPDRIRRGHLRITRDTITHEEFAPPGAPIAVAEGQVLCIEWPGGSGMATMLDERWGEPTAVDLALDEGQGAPALLIVGLVAVVIAAASWLAFRHERPTGS